MSATNTDIPFSEALARMARGRRAIAICSAVGIVIGLTLALISRHIFVSEIVALPQSQNAQGLGGGASIAKRLSGLASVAGIPLGGGLDSDSRDTAIASLSSYESLSAFIATEDIQTKVLAEASSFDIEAGGFVKKNTMWRAVREFKKHVVITPSKESGLLRISVEWYDPQTASKWTNDLVKLVDDRLRAKALQTAQARMNYLQKQLETNPVVSIREVISGMMENELRTMATAGADKEFAFRIIDPAIPAEIPSRPHRALIVIAFTFGGAFLGAIFAVLSNRYRLPPQEPIRTSAG